VTITEEEGEDRLVLRAEGSRRALSDLRVELTVLSTSKYFMVGSTFMMARNSPQLNVKLSFGDARGGYHALHQSHQRSVPILKFCQQVPTADWIRDTAVGAFKDKLEKQLVSLPTDRNKFLDTLEAGVGMTTYFLQTEQSDAGFFFLRNPFYKKKQ
jgi:hypothetical protein